MRKNKKEALGTRKPIRLLKSKKSIDQTVVDEGIEGIMDIEVDRSPHFETRRKTLEYLSAEMPWINKAINALGGVVQVVVNNHIEVEIQVVKKTTIVL